MKCDFFVGQTVICIDDTRTCVSCKQELVEGQAYTITRIEPILCQPIPNQYSDGPSIGVHLLGVRGADRVPFDYRRFRKPIEGELKDEDFIVKKAPNKRVEPV
jgi:hypothetical protein